METTDVKEVPVSEEQVAETTPVEETVPVKAGDKTEPNLLLESLQKERDKRRELEAQLQALKEVPESDVFSDEGKALKGQIQTLQSQITSMKEEGLIQELQAKYPALKDKSAEFNQFRQDYPLDKLDTAAKIFLTENDLLEVPQPRKGLEKSSGGGRVAPQQGLTVDEVSDLRKNNFRRYSQMVREGKIK